MNFSCEDCMRCTCPADSKLSVWCPLSGAWNRKRLLSVRVAWATYGISQAFSVRDGRSPLLSQRPGLLPSSHYPSLHPDSGRRGSAEEGHPLLTSFGLTQPHFLSAHCPLSAPGHLAISGCQGGWEMKSSCVDFW